MDRRHLVLGLVLASLAACTAAPVLLNGSEEGVMVRYSTAGRSDEAVAAAQTWCGQYGRKAVLQGASTTTDIFETFSCVKP